VVADIGVIGPPVGADGGELVNATRAKIVIPDIMPETNPKAVKANLFIFIRLLFRFILIKRLILHKDNYL
jgi:hypothetical protein